MSYTLIAAGILLLYLDYMGTDHVTGAGRLLYQEMWGAQDPFWKWFGALALVGLLGYVPDLQPIAQYMLVLILLAMILSHGNAFAQLVGSL